MKILSWISVLMAFLLMMWGNLVSATGSGLACPDWPLCYGSIAPKLTKGVFYEWGHRVIAGITAIITCILAYKCLTNNSTKKVLRCLVISALVLLVIQVLLGGVTVLLELSMTVSTIHLVIASIFFGFLLSIATYITWKKEINKTRENKKIKKILSFSLIAFLIQIILGGLLRHGGIGLSCPSYPSCSSDSFMPSPFMFETFLAFFHRWWAFVIIFSLIYLYLNSKKESKHIKRMILIIVTLSIIQVIYGIASVLGGLDTNIRIIHAGLSYSIWGFLIYISIRLKALDSLFLKAR